MPQIPLIELAEAIGVHKAIMRHYLAVAGYPDQEVEVITDIMTSAFHNRWCDLRDVAAHRDDHPEPRAVDAA